MLDTDTKTRIDSARDILVGKVPDPKSQVEQITIALIYKFMDDMDRQSEELGGKASFFTGEFRRYAWTKLMDPRLGGHERLLLYAEGIEKMNENKKIPQLFRDIFRGVFLPYRDPQTLHLFLKEIDGFSYDHSERLGDAYEYLLAVLGSQGDAGQFRTPRHIIDFIVAVVDPQKQETILDPACGTAGFLISSFKHILAQNTKDRPGDLLNADERGRLMANFCGYDIAPDMVRLSRVNMYLHGFANPRIHEYDTLTSEERWDDRYDVILANPPFMSPKGGIRPHNRFSIKATRSEVLFVDYIAEHLNVNGRAGVIVPEGIIFQSQNAYKKLRAMLVENYLWCVASLPAGCFNPYSGVKTSILFMDKSLAKRTDEILFVKVQNDGFDLGAQRRPIEKNDLPAALEVVQKWRRGRKEAQGEMAHPVSRKRILDSGDCSLSGDRYRETSLRVTSEWPMVRLGDVCRVESGFGFPLEYQGEPQGSYPFLKVSDMNLSGNETYIYRANNYVDDEILRKVKAEAFPRGTIIFPKIGAAIGTNKKRILTIPSIFDNNVMGLVSSRDLQSDYLYFLLLGFDLSSWASQSSPPSIRKSDVENWSIPLPPLEVQERIVAELDGYRKIIEGAKQVIANYIPTVQIDPKWPMVEMGKVCEISASLVDPKDPNYRDLKHVSAENIESGTGQLLPLRTARQDGMGSSKYLFDSGCVLYSKIRPYLRKAATVDFRGLCSADMYPVKTDSKQLLPEYLLLILLSEGFTRYAVDASNRARMPKVNRNELMSYQISLPPAETQRQVVEGIEAERALVEANRKLVEVFEGKIQAKLAEIWGEV